MLHTQHDFDRANLGNVVVLAERLQMSIEVLYAFLMCLMCELLDTLRKLHENFTQKVGKQYTDTHRDGRKLTLRLLVSSKRFSASVRLSVVPDADVAAGELLPLPEGEPVISSFKSSRIRSWSLEDLDEDFDFFFL